MIFSKKRVAAEFVAKFSNALSQFKQTPAFRALYRKYFPDTTLPSASTGAGR